MQLTTVMHLLALIVPIVVLAVLNVIGIEPSGALLGALAALTSYAGASSVVGLAKDRIVLRKSGASPKPATPKPATRREEDTPTKRWSQEAPVSKRPQKTGGQ